MHAASRVGSLRGALEPVAVFVVLAALWEWAVDIFAIKPYLLPALSSVLRTFWYNRMMLLDQALVTGGEIVLGYAAAVMGGVLIALAIFVWPAAYRMFYPVLVVFQGLPKIALAPLMIVWVGYGISSKVLMAFLFAFFPVMISTFGGLAGTPEHLVEHFRAIRASPWTMFRRLQLPAALPSIMDGCKTAMPLAVIGAIVGEFVGSQSGLGYLILESNAQARTDLLFAALVAISLLAGLLYWMVELLASRIWWRAL